MKNMEQPGNGISEEQLEALLRHAFPVQELNEPVMDTMARHLFSAAPAIALDAAKEQALLEKLSRNFPRRRNWRLNFLWLTLLLAFIGAAVFYNYQKQDDSTAFIPQLPSPQKENAPVAAVPDSQQVTKTETPEVLSTISEPLPLPAFIQEKDTTLPIADVPQPFYANHGMHIPEEVSYSYEDVPTLSEETKQQTAKDKQRILRTIGAKRSSFLLIPEGATNVDGKLTKVSSFSMKASEVTNLEYRTFLNDLLLQGRTEDYLIAQPVKNGWAAAGLPDFDNFYFTSKKYNDFPAVNMSRKGAQLYCEWLTASMKEAITNKEVKWSAGKMPDFRLPSNAEWIYAARGGDTTMMYPWGKVNPNSTQNRNGCFLCNFNYTASKATLGEVKICAGYSKLHQRGYPQPVVTTAGLAIDSLLTAPVYSYNPNDFGLYCMLGNVSEMVWAGSAAGENPGEARALGASWNTAVDNVKIESAEQYAGVNEGSAMIGFRPVMTYASGN